MKKAYETIPGTLPHRAIEFLRERGATMMGKEVPTGVICDFLETDLTTFGKSMEPARRHGLVRARTIPGKGRSFWWCLGKGEPDVAEDFEPDAPLPRKGEKVTVRPGPMFPPAVDGAQQQYEIPVFRAALWSDDSMVIEGATVRDGKVVLDAQQLAAVKRLVGAPS